MKTITHVVLIAALTSCPAVNAQQPAASYVFRNALQPGAIIGGRTFTQETSIGRAVLNDAGEVAFIASQPDPGSTAVFTSRRIVARQGDAVGGKYIMLLSTDALLAINNAGQVAYEAWYADTKEMAVSGEATGRGIFVDDHLASTAVFDARGNASAFVLTDDGRIVRLKEVARPAAPPAAGPNEPSLLDSIPPIKPPKGLPVPLPPIPRRPNRPKGPAPKPIAGERPASPLFAMNHRGQVLIPVNYRGGGFLLLLGTPSPR